MGYPIRATCIHCQNPTRFWVQDNGRAMCPCSARRTWTLSELNAETLTYHGKTPECATWVVENYQNRQDYADNQTVQLWLNESRLRR